MAELNEFELLELSDYIVNSEREKEIYFIQAHESRIFISVAIYDSKKTINYAKFSSFIFLDENKNLNLELLANEFNARKFEDAIVIGAFKLDGVKIVFESNIESWENFGNYFELNISHPTRMIRYQRRGAFRVNIPLRYDIKIDLNEDFKNLRVTNLSILGAALLINADEKFFEENSEFTDAKINLNYNNKKKSFNVTLIIRHRRESENLLKSKDEKKWYEVGVQFRNSPSKMEKEIALLVNDISNATKL